MNLMEHYIIKIHGTKEFEKYPDMIEVDVTYNCFGNKDRTKHFTTKKQWEKDVNNGYFMA